MMFKNATFYKNDVVGKDELGNPIYEEVPIGDYPTLITQWTSEEIALEDREVTENQRKLLTHAPSDIIQETMTVSVDGDKYTKIILKSDFNRWRLCHVKEFKK